MHCLYVFNGEMSSAESRKINSFTLRKIAMGLESPRQVMVLNSIDAISHLLFPFKLKTLISIVCTKGELSVSLDLVEHTLTPSTIMAVRPGHMLNGYRASEDFEGFLIMAPLSSLNHSLPSFSRLLSCFLYFRDHPVIDITSAELDVQQHLFAALLSKQKETKSPYYDNVLDSLYQSILYETLSLYTSHMKRNVSIDSKLRRKEELFYRFLLLVEAQYQKERSVIYYAEKLNITPKHLSAVAKETSGHTAGEWIDSYVILEAKMLLHNSELSIQEISSRLNFANQSFFGKYFKHHLGMSPRAYRRTAIPEI